VAKTNAFHPDFRKYAGCVELRCSDERWPASLKQSFEQYVREGGGFVAVHAADNASNWPAFNEMIDWEAGVAGRKSRGRTGITKMAS
jgi:hypothetical protein